ncbi:MAG: hypothetical protein K9J45_13730 [Bacteroidales bacterium]|nr:hypothetical protein [Bacteroidales bacterium]
MQNPFRLVMACTMLCLATLSTLSACAQYDSLLNMPFNVRYPKLLGLLSQNQNASDSARLVAELDARATFAKAKKDPQLLAEIESVRFKGLCKKSHRDYIFVALPKNVPNRSVGTASWQNK